MLYTIGTSGIRYIHRKASDAGLPTAMIDALDNKFVAFVSDEVKAGVTPAYTLRDTHPDQFTIGIVIPPSPSPGVTPGLATLYLPVRAPDFSWIWPSPLVPVGTFDAGFVAQVIAPAGGIIDVPYAFARGNTADKAYARKVDGMPYYDRQLQELYIWDEPHIAWVPVGGSGSGGTVLGSVPIGGIVTWPSLLPMPLDATGVTDPHWLRADGSEVLISAYTDLNGVYLNNFGPPSNPGMFKLPVYGNGIIRAL